MTNTEETKSDVDEQTNNVLAAAVVAALVAAATAIGFYLTQFASNGLSAEVEKWGQFGDYFGGVINPVVGLITVFLVVMSISIQRKELRASLAEMKAANAAAQKMSFEQSLFAWLGQYRELLSPIRYDTSNGRSALLGLHDVYLTLPHVIRMSNHGSLGVATSAALILKVEDDELLSNFANHYPSSKEAYERLYANYGTELDALLRTLYRIIQWIDKSPLDVSDRWHYVALVRAQLSWAELAIVYFNCLSPRGKKFAELANKYALLDNLDGQRNPLIQAAIIRADTGFTEPLTSSAFSSDIAKRQFAEH